MMDKTIMGSLLAAISLVAGLNAAHAARPAVTKHDIPLNRSAPGHDAAAKHSASVFGVAALDPKVLHCTAGGPCG